MIQSNKAHHLLTQPPPSSATLIVHSKLWDRWTHTTSRKAWCNSESSSVQKILAMGKANTVRHQILTAVQMMIRMWGICHVNWHSWM